MIKLLEYRKKYTTPFTPCNVISIILRWFCYKKLSAFVVDTFLGIKRQQQLKTNWLHAWLRFKLVKVLPPSNAEKESSKCADTLKSLHNLSLFTTATVGVPHSHFLFIRIWYSTWFAINRSFS